MNLTKKSFMIAVLACVSFLFAAPKHAQAQQTREHILLIKIHVEPQAAAYIKFDGVDGECQVKEGRNVVGRNLRTGDQFIAMVRGGQPSEFGVQAVNGTYRALSSTSTPCNRMAICTTFQQLKCFTLPGGECICICGAWMATGSR